MKLPTSVLLLAVLATLPFALPTAAKAETAPCVGVFYYDSADTRVCVSNERMSAMTVGELKDILAQIEHSVLKVAAVNLEYAKVLADEADTRIMTLWYSLAKSKKEITFGGSYGDNMNSAVGDMAKIAADNSFISVKQRAVETLSHRLREFSYTGQFPK
jgi:hypothetical protein